MTLTSVRISNHIDDINEVFWNDLLNWMSIGFTCGNMSVPIISNVTHMEQIVMRIWMIFKNSKNDFVENHIPCVACGNWNIICTTVEQYTDISHVIVWNNLVMYCCIRTIFHLYVSQLIKIFIFFISY